MATKSARRATISTPRRISTTGVASKTCAPATAADPVSPPPRPASTRLSRARREAALENHTASTTIQNNSNNNKQQTRTSRRSSITALTASARAKQVKTTNPDDRPKNTNAATRPCNAPEPNKKMITRQRSKSVLVSKDQVSNDAGNRSLMEINKRLLAALLSDETPGAGTASSKESSTTTHQKAVQNRENVVDIFKDGEDDDIFERNRKAIGDARKPSRSAARRRQSMPPISMNETPELSSTDDKELWNELTSLKSRLIKLEGNRLTQADTSEQSSETTSSCMFDATPGSPSTATSTADSPSASRFMTVQQKRLLDALALVEQTGIPAAKAMRTVVHEAITTNQVLWSSIPHDLATDARTLIGLQKSSDNQVKELTEALYLMASPPTAKPSGAVYHRRSLDEQAHMQSLYGGYAHRRFSTDRSSITSSYHLPHLTQHSHHHHTPMIHGGRPVSEYYEKPTVPYSPPLPSAAMPVAASTPSASGGTAVSASTASPEMASPRPFRIAGILDYPFTSSYSRQPSLPATNYHYYPQSRSKHYEPSYSRSGGSEYT
ncbi:hypothetical protein BCR43DRAFT_490388 [Syncephalastrum racemosum]|uniref:Uncharacterized protein n=1 Tax=Syncephalastrum racemosum TaxID=13706 RepID=A0A1X2HFR4_SYNRA|nr:hypothetical protein BCR43DRAFT_490388 [Syncephalastrum racemosum]